MNKILYLLRYLINNKKVKKFITIVLMIFAVMSFLEIKSHAAEEITSPYYFDGVAETYREYDALQRDFVVRCLNYIRYNNRIPDSIRTICTRMSNGGYSFMFYYGDALGSAYQNTYPSSAQKNVIEIITMDSSQITSTTANYDWGLNGVQSVRGYLSSTQYLEFKFNRDTQSYNTLAAQTARHWLPSYLLSYKSSALTMFLEEFNNGSLLENSTALINAIENQTDIIEEQGQQITNSINDTNDFLQEETDNTISTDLTVEPVEIDNENSQNISDFVTYFPNKLQEAIEDYEINSGRGGYSYTIPLPHSNQNVTFYSDMLYRYLNGTQFQIIKTFINFAWYFVFGGACIRKIKRIYDWFQSGQIATEGGLIKFNEVLKGENEFFNQFMM